MSPEQIEAAEEHLMALRCAQGFPDRVSDPVALVRISEIIRPIWEELMARRAAPQKVKGQPES